MNLDTPDKTIEIVLGEAMVTTNCDITAAYAIVATDSFLLAANDLVSNGTTPVTVVPAPALPPGSSAEQNQVKEIRLHNNDTVTHQVTLRLNNGGTIRIIEETSVAPSADFLYTPETVAVVSADVPAILLESGTSGEKISAMPSGDTLVTGFSIDPGALLPMEQAGTNYGWSFGSIYTVVAQVTDFFANPLNAPAASNTDGQPVIFVGGDGDGTGSGGFVRFFGGTGGATGSGGSLSVGAGDASANGAGGSVALFSGAGVGAHNGGDLSIVAGPSGAGATGNGGLLLFQTNAAASTNGNGGDIQITLGAGAGAGRQGQLIATNLPAADPSVSTAIWESNGRLVQSGAIIDPVASTIASGSAVALVTGTAKDVTTISVPAGNWTISGAVYFTGNAATTVTLVQGSVGTTANTLDTTPGQFDTEYLAGATLTVLAADPALLGFSADVTLGGTTTYRLDAKATFAINTLSAYGTIRAVPRA